jgi:hypothetical protein
MRRTFMVAAIAGALSAAAFGQSDSRPPLSQTEKKLIAMSRQLVGAETEGLAVAAGGVIVTPSGAMEALEVKGHVPGALESPVVRITGAEAVVTGRVVFRGRSPEGQAINASSAVRIRYVREDGRWKFVYLCLGTCGSEPNERP